MKMRLFAAMLLAGCVTWSMVGPELSAQEEQEKTENHPDQKNTAESLKIEIKDEPKTIDPVKFVIDPLRQKVSVKFDGKSVREIIEWMRDRLQMAILVDPDLADEVFLLTEPVTEQLDNDPLYLLLERLRAVGLDWYVKDGVLHISTSSNDGEQLTTIPQNIGEFLDREFDPDRLMDAIVNGTDIEAWEDEGGPGSLILLGDVLFVRQSHRIHRQVSMLLEAIRNHGRRTFVGESDKHELLRKALDKKIDVSFADTPLAEAFSRLAKTAETDIRIDRAVFEMKRVRAREPVSLTLKNQKLSMVLQAMAAPHSLTWTLQNGVIVITDLESAERNLKTAVFDVRDLSRDDNEAEALHEALVMQSEGWIENGGQGSINFARPGIMVVRTTEKMHADVLKMLELYRQALKNSKVRKKKTEDPEEVITEYYRMPKIMADDLEKHIRELVDAESWQTGENGKGQGTLLKLASRPDILGTGESPALLENSVLIVKQHRKNHVLIRELIRNLEFGQRPPAMTGGFGGEMQGGFGGGQGGGGLGGGPFGGQGTEGQRGLGGAPKNGKRRGGGFGGGFFSIPDRVR